jgi:hypothetical protein
MILVEYRDLNIPNMQKCTKEIGSEFWMPENVSEIHMTRGGKESYSDAFLLSGRTAIDAIIQDILSERLVTNVYMPAWGCDSMIVPFADRGIKVELYDVSLEEDGLHFFINENKACDIFYVNNYFGYHDNVSNEVIEHFKKKGAIILYDRTHSFLMLGDNTEALADYTFTSIRKWMGVVAGAVISKKKGQLIDLLLDECPYLNGKIEAMKEKAAFIGGDPSINKQDFLNKYGEFGHHLVEDYSNYKMDALSLSIYQQSDLQQMRETRRANARVLHEGVNLHFISNLSGNDSPLFVPVFFASKEQRDAVRKALIAESIYCPIHWPKNYLVADSMKVNDILDRELSLICDQRYLERDMQRIVKIINKNI